jgi:hypothetical protein
VRAVGIASRTTAAVRTGSKEARAWPWTRRRGGGAVVHSTVSTTDDAGKDSSSEERRTWRWCLEQGLGGAVGEARAWLQPHGR